VTQLRLKIRKDGYPWRDVALDADPDNVAKLRETVAAEMRKDGWRYPEHGDRFSARVLNVRFPDRSFDLAV
jgi:hypothetical protein